LLAFVACGRRSEYGVYAILLGHGIGSKIVRIAAPVALLIPLALEAIELGLMHRGLMDASYSTALTTSLLAMLAFGIVLMLGWRIDKLESAISDLSLRDELTGLYNRRGFFVLAGQALRRAHRSRTPLSVLFIDLDHLKQINDTYGHDAGSMFLVEVADLLKRSLRESDVIGRIGGDEFVVTSDAGDAGIQLAAQRLQQAALLQNSQPGRQYPLSFSLGYATSEVDRPESLEDLVSRADKAMYAAKQLKQLARP
jgi:diguanylate cyclase (GGDEF)-like protein